MPVVNLQVPFTNAVFYDEGGDGVPCRECPTNGRNSLLYNRNTNMPSECSLLDEQRLPGLFIGCDDFPEVYDCIGGLCCPTRGCSYGQPQSFPLQQENKEEMRTQCTAAECSCCSEQFECAQVDRGVQQCCPSRGASRHGSELLLSTLFPLFNFQSSYVASLEAYDPI
ncbi:unnamed protein product [Haemonchus placei]|uniref:EB domain-containing protein n=1 Tax=Haemonchus placei TaxID=6290 RepID=A0A0N4WUA7_HAEPC|nr:unnamed protein product [Haemonchus placei]